MQNEKIYITRIERFKNEIAQLRFTDNISLKAEYIYDQEYPITYDKNLEDFSRKDITLKDNQKYTFQPIRQGEEWGKTWGSSWFRFTGKIPAGWKGKEVGALIDLEAEGCLFKDGTPHQGLTNKIHWNVTSAKRLIIINQKAEGNEDIKLLVEGGANGLFGAGQEFYRLQQAELCLIDSKAWQLYYDLEVISSLISKLPQRSPRRQKLIRISNDAINLFENGKGIKNSLKLTGKLLAIPANKSAINVYSVGHSHLDLGWLWPVRETRRKAGRTFATALRMMEEYPEYVFGSSQPQLYEWVKEDYPKLYQEIKNRISEGRWECQGAMWVEPDMNLIGGEAMVRQCLYGKKFWKEEFDQDVNNLWLPDVFGYSAALPQILKKCGVDYFMTQKISWNETNIFPHHSFYWEGIDGTKIATHFLPTNDYNCSNLPKQLLESEERFAQSDVADEFLNLYGIGDGGGGPGRIHIELGKRQQNTEGAVNFIFSTAEDFFKRMGRIPASRLPLWKGELYLELHRGTYTTQALMKKYNRQLELNLRDVEFLGAITGNMNKEVIDRIWKNTLLNQFHDILPGSSIKWVYEDAHALSEANLRTLREMKNSLLAELNLPAEDGQKDFHYQIFNTLSWKRKDVINLELPDDNENWIALDAFGNQLPANLKQNLMLVEIEVPPMGYTTIKLQKVDMTIRNTRKMKVNENLLENNLLRVEFDEQGVISSIFDKELHREMLSEAANIILLYEDKPNDWGAWDINHFYRETQPEQAKLSNISFVEHDYLWAAISMEFTIGNSTISQIISLKTNSKLLECWTSINWQEKNKMLRMRVVPDIKTDKANFEIQYGNITRATHNNTTWEQAKFEVCGHRYADLSQSDCGFAIVNDCKYGHYVKDNIMELTLLRSPQYPDNTADIGEHTFRYGFLPHSGNLINSQVLPIAHEFNSELIVHKIAELPEQLEKAYFSICGKNVKIESVKPAEDGDGIILRLYEYYGTQTEIKLKSDRNWKEFIETDLLENSQYLHCKDARETSLFFEPFEIRTFRLKYGK
ncbi:MAG: glycoside hydrolase family 38 C-terminal domain-containing protein [Candidatus Stygibacter australis]|nr:glycoside hydrolase family 38 C-terminal domain-containing protein [Candidatus Stygibacter australis]